MQELPTLFVSHGAPDLLLSQEPALQALVSLGQTLPQPKGILVISAHWQAAQFTLGVAPEYSTIHDFSGFPAALYQLSYPAKGADWLSELCRQTLQEANIDYSVDPLRGLDHGAWVPLMLAWPKAEIPILTLSLKNGASLLEYLRLGHALTSLRRSGVLLMSSGAITHNLGELLPPGSEPESWALEFAKWLEEKLSTGETAELLEYRSRAPFAQKAHPTPEHFEPLLVAYGAGGERSTTQRHQSFSHGNLAMDIYLFGKSVEIENRTK